MKHIFVIAAVSLVLSPPAPVFGGDDTLSQRAQPPAPLEVRAAVQRSLPFIEKVGQTWMDDRNCNSCHVVTFQLWSHTAAASHGLDVDKTKLDEWIQWALADAKSDRYWFKLRPHSMDALKADGMDAAILAKLKPLAGKSHITEKLFLDALQKALGPDDFARHKELLIRTATLPNNGGGSDTLAQLLLGRRSGGEDKATSDAYAAVRALLLEWQLPDGSWAADGQLPDLKWANAKEMHDCTTMWSLLALGADSNPAEAGLVRARERAREYLKNATPGETVQSLALHLMVAHQWGDRSQEDVWHADLLKRQNADGGWSWWKANKNSDAFATGQALYAMGWVGRAGSTPSVTKAWSFLVDSQTADGSWQVPQEAVNTRPGKLNVYILWGTAWAAIGLLQTLPDGGADVTQDVLEKPPGVPASGG